MGKKTDEPWEDLLLGEDTLSSFKQQEENGSLQRKVLLKEAKRLQEKQRKERAFLLQKINAKS